MKKARKKGTMRILLWALCLLLAGSVLQGLTGSMHVAAASYPKLKTINYTAPVNQRTAIVGYAKTQIGYEEGANNNTYFGNWFGLNYNPWCAMFVSWCAAKAGVSKSVLPRQANADRGWAKDQGVYYPSKQWGGTYTPKKGDLIYFSWSVKDYADHIGIVTGTQTVGKTVYVNTIEGNKFDKVVEQQYKLSSKYILGYASPKYFTGVFTVKVTHETGINIRSGHGLKYAIKGRAKKDATYKISKVYNGWGRIKGTSTWIMLKYTKITAGYRAKVTISNLNLRAGPGKSYTSVGKLAPGTYVISKISGKWGKVKANGYWISLDYAKQVK